MSKALLSNLDKPRNGWYWNDDRPNLCCCNDAGHGEFIGYMEAFYIMVVREDKWFVFCRDCVEEYGYDED